MPAHAESRRLRKGRYSEIGQIYLVTSVVRKREPVFNDLLMGRLLVRELRRCEEQKLARTLAWVVMPDHFHWLFELQDKSLSGVVQQLKARSSIAVGKLKPEQTPLWQPGYHDKAIRKEQDLVGVARYVVANPIRAGLVTKLGDYSLWDAIWI
ncbi:REP element-mobilizing transposase RayT [Pseudomonas asturiensis]|uniref:REP element-mobilizing transposase RayT n=1 Tax=Pseudomonas asturiensis TaxID=1190415 RepID=A0A1M7QA32_9PSED|nr:transposase [Pseudomonas asturiensis]SHN27437.1 REP element-mobilizing transposase RayT [Pseudomonas asturiensis]